jgi:hypothetical protein
MPKRRERYVAVLQARLEQRTERQIRRQLARFDLKTDEGKKAFESFIERLSDRRKNLHIKPEFTPQVVGACQQILAFGMAGLGLGVAFSARLADITPFWQSMVKTAFLVSLNLTAMSFLVLVWFFIQARSRYPFLFLDRLGNAAPFFYYETLSRTWHYPPIRTRRGILNANFNYLVDLGRFAQTLVNENADPIERARYELQQYYLLIVYQAFLDQFEMQLEHIFLYGTVSGVLSALVVSTWWFL